MFPWYFQLFLKTINMRCEYFQIDTTETRSRFILWITDYRVEQAMLKQFPNITIRLIPADFKEIFETIN